MNDFDELLKIKVVYTGERENDTINEDSFKEFEQIDFINADSYIQDNSTPLIDALRGSDLVFIVASADSVKNVSTITMIADCSLDAVALTIGVITNSHAFDLYEWGNR